MAVPSEAMKLRIRRAGSTMLFSGPIEPSMLGAAVGSARLHLSEDLASLQRGRTHREDRPRGGARESVITSRGRGARSLTHLQLHCDSSRMNRAISSACATSVIIAAR